MSALDTVITPIHKEGYPFIAGFALFSFILGLFSPALLFIGGLLTAWCVYFFRDPDRVTPDRAGLIVSPADGTVIKIEKALIPKELDMGEVERTRISVFLNVFNVHVNRVPVKGTITHLHYHPGKFLNASLDKASEDNERQTACVRMETGEEVIFVQIAGLVARRIVCYLKQDQEVETGERYGIIRFGSRADIYLPDGVVPRVIVGQKVTGGETILADIQNDEAEWTGITH